MLSEFFPCSRRVVFIAEQYKIPLFRSTMVVCGRRHVTYVCFIDKKRTNPLSLWTLKKNKNTQNGMKIIWYIRALENVNLVSTIISMIYSIWLLSMVRFSINIEWNIDKNLSFNNRYNAIFYFQNEFIWLKSELQFLSFTNSSCKCKS